MSNLWLPPEVLQRMAQERRYTAAELVALADEHHLPATEPLLRDWVRLGLMGKPEEAGERGVWIPPQASLWLKLLDIRQRQRAHVVHLCNVPVGGWIYFGEATGGVSHRQALRAMRSWVERQRPNSLEAARRTAQRLVKLCKTKDAVLVRSAKKQLNELLAHHRVDIASFRDPLVLLMEGRMASKRGQRKGPAEASLSVEMLLDMWQTRIDAMNSLAKIADWMWEWARVALVWGVQWYTTNQARLAREAQQYSGLEQLYQRETLESFVSSACLDMLTMAGLALDATRHHPSLPPLPGLPDHLQLGPWRDGVYTAEVQGGRPMVGLHGQLLSVNGQVRIHRKQA